jgi:site-specific recombinase XerD
VPEATLPIADALARYLADCRRRGLREPTIRYYKTAISRFGNDDRCSTLADFTREKVRSFQDDSPTLSLGSMRGYLRALRTFSTWLFGEDLIEVDHLAKLALPRVDRRLILVPSDTELLALLDASGTPLRALIALLAGTGLRISDACALDALDLKEDVLHVQTTKNRGGRIVPLDGVLIAILHTYVADLRPVPRTEDGNPLFVSRTHRRLTAGAARLALRAAARRANLPMPVGPHVLRHWFARDLAGHGTTDRLLAARMGWTSTGLMGRYAPVTDAEMAADTARYSPLQRLSEGGKLIRRLPSTMRARRRSASVSNSVTESGRSAGRTR